MRHKNNNPVAGGVFLIGLAVLFLTSYWFPGILFVIGITAIVGGFCENKRFESAKGGFFLIALGVVFAVGFNIGLLFLLLGLGLLLSAVVKMPRQFGIDTEKTKRKNSEPEYIYPTEVNSKFS